MASIHSWTCIALTVSPLYDGPAFIRSTYHAQSSLKVSEVGNAEAVYGAGDEARTPMTKCDVARQSPRTIPQAYQKCF